MSAPGRPVEDTDLRCRACGYNLFDRLKWVAKRLLTPEHLHAECDRCRCVHVFACNSVEVVDRCLDNESYNSGYRLRSVR